VNGPLASSLSNKAAAKNTSFVSSKNDASRGPGKNDRERRTHVIHNDKELEVYTNALFELAALEKPSLTRSIYSRNSFSSFSSMAARYPK